MLFEHGEFGPTDTEATAIPLFFFTLGITAQAIIQILPRAFYAFAEYLDAGNTGVIAWLKYRLDGCFGGAAAHGGLALAVTLGALKQMVLLFFVLRESWEELTANGC